MDQKYTQQVLMSKAQKMFQNALKLARTIDKIDELVELRLFVANAQIEVGIPEEAKATVKSTAKRLKKERKKYIQKAKNIDQIRARFDAATKIVEFQKRLGLNEELQKTLGLIKEFPNQIKKDEFQSWSLWGYAAALAKAGQTSNALEITNRISEEEPKNSALFVIFETYTNAEEIAQAQEILKQLSPNLVAFGKAKLAAQKPELIAEAQKTLEHIEDNSIRALCLTEIATAFRKNNQKQDAENAFEAAMKSVSKISDPNIRYHVLSSMGDSMYMAKNTIKARLIWLEALETAKLVDSYSSSVEYLSLSHAKLAIVRDPLRGDLKAALRFGASRDAEINKRRNATSKLARGKLLTLIGIALVKAPDAFWFISSSMFE